jgi:hypothetical protein
MAGRIAIYQGAQANLVGNAGSSEALGDDADDDAKHGGAAIEKLSPFELFHVDLGFAAVEILVVGGSVGHDVKKMVVKQIGFRVRKPGVTISGFLGPGRWGG